MILEASRTLVPLHSPAIEGGNDASCTLRPMWIGHCERHDRVEILMHWFKHRLSSWYELGVRCYCISEPTMLPRHMGPSCPRLSWVFGTSATIQPLKLRCNCCLGGRSLGIARASRGLAALYNTGSCRETSCLHFKEKHAQERTRKKKKKKQKKNKKRQEKKKIEGTQPQQGRRSSIKRE